MSAHIGDRQLDRRAVIVGTAKLAGAGALAALLAERAGIAMAQDPAAPVDPATLGLPELSVTISASGYELSTDTVPAGLLLFTVHNTADQPFGAAVLGPGPGMTMQDLQNAAATPTANDAFPSFFYDVTIPGGPGDVPPGGTSQAILNIPEGDWVVWGDGDQGPSFFSATAGSPAPAAEPAADLTVTELEFAFAGLAGAIPAGPQTWRVENTGKQPHMLVLGKVPDTTTMDQVMEVMQRPENATPPPGGLGDNDFQDAGGVLMQSAGTTVWTMLDLQHGRHLAACWVPDQATGQPHAMMGMVALFDAGGGTPTA